MKVKNDVGVLNQLKSDLEFRVRTCGDKVSNLQAKLDEISAKKEEIEEKNCVQRFFLMLKYLRLNSESESIRAQLDISKGFYYCYCNKLSEIEARIELREFEQALKQQRAIAERTEAVEVMADGATAIEVEAVEAMEDGSTAVVVKTVESPAGQAANDSMAF